MEMTLRRFKSVTQHINGLRSKRRHRNHLEEDIYGVDISDVKVLTIASNAPSDEREVGIAEFVWSVRSMADDENIILTAIAF
jgi:hypothetical protein